MIVFVSILSVALLLSGVQPAWSQTGSQGSKDFEGIPNWGRVSETLYRGGQPAVSGYKALQQMGVSIVVNFRDEPKEIATEKREVESLGIKYVSIPWSGSSDPSNAQVVQFLDLVGANSSAKIFVHCRRGADRTGVMVAAYRIAVEHKLVSDAVSEMRKFDYAHFWLPQLERYVKSLPDLLSANPMFRAYASTPSTPSAPNAVAPVVAAGAASRAAAGFASMTPVQ
jgi:protein tyrosine phosphatase (PTP) superfamily phosphohydrolase (DUF442 family)